jgi:GNAT superfamily N-acetyltransferase
MSVSIKEVISREDMEIFVRFPHTLYDASPFWVPPLIKDELQTLNPLFNPAFESCRAKFWLAYRDGVVAGRIAGIINDNFLKKWRKPYARFGWIDFVDDYDVSGQLLSTVENWASAHTMKAVHGPLGFTDFDPEGLLVEGYDKPGVMTTIYNYPYYVDHLIRHAYHKDAGWVEYEVEIPYSVPDRIQKISGYVKERYKLEVLQADHASDLLPYAHGIFDLINKAYKNLYGVVHLGERQINFYLDQFFSFIDPDFISIVLNQENEVVSFAVAMPSLTKALKKSGGKLFPFGWYYFYQAFKRNSVADLYLIAVHPSLQKKGVSALLIEDLIKKFNKHRITRAYTHPILEKNEPMQNFWKQFASSEFRRRCCFIKPLN